MVLHVTPLPPMQDMMDSSPEDATSRDRNRSRDRDRDRDRRMDERMDVHEHDRAFVHEMAAVLVWNRCLCGDRLCIVACPLKGLVWCIVACICFCVCCWRGEGMVMCHWCIQRADNTVTLKLSSCEKVRCRWLAFVQRNEIGDANCRLTGA